MSEATAIMVESDDTEFMGRLVDWLNAAPLSDGKSTTIRMLAEAPSMSGPVGICPVCDRMTPIANAPRTGSDQLPSCMHCTDSRAQLSIFDVNRT